MMKQEKSRDRPYIADYGIEESDNGLLDWDFVQNEMKDAKNYWLSTTKSDSRPHAIPIWGSWINDNFYFGGGSETQNRKNLAENPHIIVHSESGTKVVIIEGKVSIEKNENVIKEIKMDYMRKYNLDHPPPFYRVNKTKVFCWDMNDYAGTPTRWKFNEIKE
jgi:nitroimidazol reductase NimA-like FMN-containing flavoprotein (pyridoxamine 5'-phosphate oxidase superfamily)